MTTYSISNKQFRNACSDCGLGNGDFFSAMHEFHEVGGFNRNAAQNKSADADFHYYNFYQKELKALARVIKGKKTIKFAFERLEEAACLTYRDWREAGFKD